MVTFLKWSVGKEMEDVGMMFTAYNCEQSNKTSLAQIAIGEIEECGDSSLFKESAQARVLLKKELHPVAYVTCRVYRTRTIIYCDWDSKTYSKVVEYMKLLGFSREECLKIVASSVVPVNAKFNAKFRLNQPSTFNMMTRGKIGGNYGCEYEEEDWVDVEGRHRKYYHMERVRVVVYVAAQN